MRLVSRGCEGPYSILSEEKSRHFTWGWRPPTGRNVSREDNSPWVYRNMRSLGGMYLIYDLTHTLEIENIPAILRMSKSAMK